MAKKSNKAKSQEPRPNPPKHINISITTLQNLMHRNPGTTKSWLNTGKQCKQPRWPQLIEFTCPQTMPNRRNTMPILDRLKLLPYPPPLPVIMNISMNIKRLPSTALTIPCPLTLMVMTGVSNPAFLLYHRKLGESRWITHKSTTVDPYDLNKRFMKFTNNDVGCDGKLYALTLQGSLVVMEEKNDARFVITGTCKSRVVPSVSAKYYKEYMLVLNEKILLVFLIYGRKCISSAEEVEVYKLDFDRLELVKVDKLDGRVLFLGNAGCGSANPRELGCKGDCVYFRGGLSNEWWMYDMQSGCISVA